ncbi:hypothetical protein CYMTET_13264 [Cymbomonas tetramitiformis]|uniref:Uncharacterized protein n=1 Tax=Cymbomonas tetramitiformis TaxID=36881 RepID=A0AAE0LBK5_9CHLO|nr:hypothetical protein CYMTET_13264 [Cymbomonas tetramitiformis]
MISHAEPLPSPVQRVETQRWYVLAVFSTVSALNNVVWITFSSVSPSVAAEYYGIHRRELNQLLNYGPLLFLLVAPFTSWLLTRPSGMRYTVLLGAFLVFAGSIVRIVPTWAFTEHNRCAGEGRWLLHLGQILNALSGPLVISPVSRLSALWFPAEQRAGATAIAQVANGFGSAVSWFLGPWLASTASGMPHLLYVIAVLTGLPFVAAVIHFPDRPAVPPTAVPTSSIRSQVPTVVELNAPLLLSASHADSHPSARGEPATTSLAFREGLRQACMNRSFLLLVAAFGMCGVQQAWVAQLQTLLQGVLGAKAIGVLAVVEALACTLCGVACGFIADSKFRRRFKLLIVLALTICTLASIHFMLSLSSPFSSRPIFPTNAQMIGVSILIIGSTLGTAMPLLFELSAELTYPVPEGTSAGVMLWVFNMGCFVLLLVSSYMSVAWINVIWTLTLIMTTLLMCAVDEQYRRSDAEDQIRGTI